MEHRFFTVDTNMSLYRSIEWNEFITIYHKVDELVLGKKVTSWEQSIYEGCFWKLKDKQVMSDNQLITRKAIIVRIPVDVNEGVVVDVGDVVVKGKVAETISSTPTALLNKYKSNSFLVNSVIDNTKLQRTAHWLISDN